MDEMNLKNIMLNDRRKTLYTIYDFSYTKYPEKATLSSVVA